MKRILSFCLIIAMLICTVPSASVAVTDTLPFTDVSEDQWFYECVSYTYEQGIFTGMNPEGTIFAPDKNITRAELVMTLFKLVGGNKESYSGETGFTDVSSASWMSYAVKWAAEKGYVNGVGGDLFNPDGFISRQELVTMLFRFAGDYYLTEDINAENFANFDDAASVASWANEAMTWATGENIIKGMAVTDTGAIIQPEGTATRAQAAQMLMTFVQMFDGSDATGIVDRDLVFAVRNTVYTEPKNIIYMISDGTGFNILEATENIYHEDLYLNKLAMNYIPQLSHQTTYSQNHHVTDSAAGGTALATGHKTSNSTIAMDFNDTFGFKTVLEIAAEKGMSTGVVVTKNVFDATPASFTAHTGARGDTEEIVSQQTEKLISGDLDILMGGGSNYFDDTYCIESGINYTEEKAGLEDAAVPFLGLFDGDNMDTHDETLPTLPEMTAKALELLSKDENGFFLMVEGSQVDVFNHDNKFEDAAREAYDFDRSVALALEFAVNNPDTVIIITADHETGGLYIPAEPTPENIMEGYEYTSTGHTERAVPLYALGKGVEELTGIVENTDVAIFVASLLGETNFGTKSTVSTIFDNSTKEAIVEANDFAEATDSGVRAVLDAENNMLSLPVDKFCTPAASIKNARAIHIEITNTTDQIFETPFVILDFDGDETVLIPQHEYMEPGETYIMSYIIDIYRWEDYAFNNLTNFYIGDGLMDYAEFELGNVYVTDRGLAD